MDRKNVWIGAGIAIVIVALVFWYNAAGPRMSTSPTQPSSATIAATTSSQTAPITSTTQPASSTPQVKIDGQTIDVTLALTQAAQAQGLGGRTGLTSHEGMLFVFPADAVHMFWMKDMEFSIDMLWFSDNGTLIYIQPNVSPATYPEGFGPNGVSRYVLELPANFAQTYGIKVGDKAILP